MALYRYKAISRAQDVVDGTIEASSPAEARDLLRGQRMSVLKLSRDWKSIEIGGAKKVKIQDLIVFTRQMSAMIDAGLPITRALAVLVQHTESKLLRRIIREVLMGIEGGDSVATAMARHPETFPPMYTKLVHAGESSGNLVSTLEEVAIFLERQEEINSRIKGAVVYPAAIGGITVAALLVLYTFVIPAFEEMFTDLEELPWLTEINLVASQFVRNSPHILAGTAFAIAMGVYLLFKNKAMQALLDRWGLKMPIVGPVMSKAAIARFARTMSTLLKSGTNLMEAMLLTADAVGNRVVRQVILDARTAVAEGSSIADPLTRSGVFPGIATSMIQVGQDSGRLDEMLGKIAVFYEKDVARATEAALELIKPITMVILALVIGSVLISVYLPMMDAMMTFGE
jgi:type IV pilus assembly protein PilC